MGGVIAGIGPVRIGLDNPLRIGRAVASDTRYPPSVTTLGPEFEFSIRERTMGVEFGIRERMPIDAVADGLRAWVERAVTGWFLFPEWGRFMARTQA